MFTVKTMFDLYEMADEMFNEIAPSTIRTAKTARHHPGSCLDQEICELKTAYVSMRKMASDYDKMEDAYNGAIDMEDGGYATDVTGPCPDAREWLNCNYEEQEDISLPRSVMYSHYIDHCRGNETEPMNQASFGKIIRSVFPNIKTRRLGNRGQSKYHYYGINIKENSPYREVMVNAQRINSISASPKSAFSKTTCPNGSLTSSPSILSTSQNSLTLPEFPNINDLRLPAQIKDTTGVFLMMYRHHSQRIVDTVLRANFAEVKSFITHFWTTLPSHVSSVLYHEKVVRVIRLCDTILYSSITNVLIPGVIQPLPSSLLQAIRAFSKNYIKWLEDALSQQPAELQKQKMQAARTFSTNLTRQTEVSHMASVARSVLHNSESIRRLQEDWKKLDKENIAKQCTWLLMGDEVKVIKIIGKYMSDFESMMEHQTTIDRYIEWVRGLATRFIDKRAQGNASYRAVARDFLLKWSFISNVVIKELTMRSAETFGSYHLLSMLFKDYIMHLVDQRLRREEDRQLQQLVYPEPKESKQFGRKPTNISASHGQRQNYQQFPQTTQSNDDKHNYMDVTDNRSGVEFNTAMQSTSLPSIYEMFSLPQVCTEGAIQALHQHKPHDVEKHTGRYYPTQDSYDPNATYKYYCTSDGSSLTML